MAARGLEAEAVVASLEEEDGDDPCAVKVLVLGTAFDGTVAKGEADEDDAEEVAEGACAVTEEAATGLEPPVIDVAADASVEVEVLLISS